MIWVWVKERRPEASGSYYWKGKHGYGGRAYYDVEKGDWEFGDNVPSNKVDDEYLYWLDEEERHENEKYVVWAENPFTLLGKEYFGTDGENVIGFHDPGRASHFPNVEAAEEFCKLFACEGRKIHLLSEHVELFKDCQYVYRKIGPLDKSIDIKYDKEKHDALAVLNWRMKQAKGPEHAVSFENYKTWPNLYSVFSYLHSLAKYSSIAGKMFYSVDLKIPEGGSYEDFYREFKLVIDYCTYVDEAGRKVFNIFDNEICAALCFRGEDDCVIANRRNILFEGTLRECFEKIRREY